MPEPTPPKRRRLDRVLDPQLLGRLRDTDADTLSRLREDADQEEAELSFVRRLLQGRLDQVAAEQERRRSGAPGPSGVLSEQELVSKLAAVLSGPPGTRTEVQRPSGRYLAAEADHGLTRRRAAEVAAADVRLSDPSGLPDDELAAALRRLEELEAQVSGVRHQVQGVADALAEELARRDDA